MIIRLLQKGFLAAVLLAGGLSSPAWAENWCKADRAPRIQVKTSTDQVDWVYTKSERDLNGFKIDTVNPYGKNVITDVGGLMQGGIELKESMRFNTLTHNRLKQICYWYDSIVISLHIRPTIFIASEFPQGTCKHDAIKAHEMKHISTDREIVNKYAKLIGEGVKKEMDRQSIYGPYNESRKAEIEAFMKARLENILKYYSKIMDDERHRRQQAIDNLNEYESVNRACR